MLATLNDKQNDPHDVIEISPDIVLASRADNDAATLAPELASRVEPKLDSTPNAGATSSVDAAVRAALSDFQASRKRSSVGKWLGGALVSVVFAAASAAAAIAWQIHGDMVKDTVAAWVPALAAPLQATPTAADQPAAEPPAQAASDDATAQAAAPQPASQPDSPASTVTAVAPQDAPSVQAMARDLASMGQQIEQLKANIAELKAGQEQMAHELAKAPQPKAAEARAVEPRARITALPPRPAARKPRPAAPPAHAATYAPTPISPQPQAMAAPPPLPPAPAPQQTADDDGPVVRPPMPVH